MARQLGMFGNLFSGIDPNENERDDRAMRLAQMDPNAALRYAANETAGGIGRGLGTAAMGAMGKPTEESTRNKAGKELKELARTVRPGTKEFYRQAADILRKYGLVEEATNMEQQAQEIEKTEFDQKDKTRQREIAAMGKGPKGTAQSPMGKLIADWQAAVKAGDTASANYLQSAIAKETKASGGGGEKATALMRDMAQWKAAYQAYQANPNDPLAKRTLEILEAKMGLGQKEGTKSEKERSMDRIAEIKNGAPERYKGELQALERIVAGGGGKGTVSDEAVRAATQKAYIAVAQNARDARTLFNHPGLPSIIGSAKGAFFENDGSVSTVAKMLSGDAANAFALLQQVRAQSFLQALNDLKEKSANNSSGLGQLTEREGQKIQDAKVALRTQMDFVEFRQNLETYYNDIMGVQNDIMNTLNKDGTPVPNVPERAPPRKSDYKIEPGKTPAKPAAPKPKANPATTAAPAAGDEPVVEWERGPDGIPRPKKGK